MTSRRGLLVGAGVIGAAGAVALAPRGDRLTASVGSIDRDNIVDLGDGFYLADGWVLTAEDLNLSSN